MDTRNNTASCIGNNEQRGGNLIDSGAKELAREIIAARKREISEMQRIVDRLEYQRYVNPGLTFAGTGPQFLPRVQSILAKNQWQVSG